jgi:hypothetical protein
LDLFAKVNIGGLGLIGPSGKAIALGHDPQYMLSPGVIVGSLSLDTGSSIVAMRPGFDSAEATFDITAPTLGGPLASLDLKNTGSGLSADVAFAADSRLFFFDATTGLPITPAAVTAALVAAAGLATDSGLASPLSLFSYAFDLRGSLVPPGAAIGSDGMSMADSISSVPEPSTFGLGGLGLVALVCWLSWGTRGRQAAF